MIKPINKHPRIAAVFATMNRSATAVACVRALAAQTRPPDLVVAADNVSSDGTAEGLENLRDLPFPLVVHRMRENRGNAGGVQEAMELAFENGVDAVWILDDDSWPRPEALAELAKPPWQPDFVRVPLQVDPATGAFTWPLQVLDRSGGWRLAFRFTDLTEAAVSPTRNNWTGALVSRHVRDKVGPVPGELFIRGEDEAYPWMMEKAGVRQEYVRSAILDHPGPEAIVRWDAFGRRMFFEPGLADWKLYYKVRNMVWLRRRQSGACMALATAIAYAIACARIDGAHRLPLVLEAARDGWKGRLGRREPG